MKKLIRYLFNLVIILLFCTAIYAEDIYSTKVYLENKLSEGVMDVFIYNNSETQNITLQPGDKYTENLQIINTTNFIVSLCPKDGKICEELIGGTMDAKEYVNRQIHGLGGKRKRDLMTKKRPRAFNKVNAYFNVTQDVGSKTGEFKVILSSYGSEEEL